MQRQFNLRKSINVIYHINKDKKYMTTSLDTEKALYRIQHPFTIKYTQETRNKKEFPQHDVNVNIYEKSTTNIILNNGRLKAFLQRSGTRK